MVTSKIPRHGSGKNLYFVLTVLISLLLTSSALEAFGSKKEGAGGDGAGVPPDTDAAIANAKRLVDALNDAATGTITTYHAGHEKEPVTCNEIMAKSLVTANEEKAAIAEERDSVVKAAALLSDRIDELTKQLDVSQKQIELMKEAISEAQAEGERKLKDNAATSNKHMAMMAEDLSSVQSKADKEVNDMKDAVAKAQQKSNDALKKEKENSELALQQLRETLETKIASIKEECYKEVLDTQKDRNMHVNKAERRIKDVEDKAEADVQAAKKEAAAQVEQARKDAEERVTAIKTDAEAKKNELKEKNKNELIRLEKELQQQSEQYRIEIFELKKKTGYDIAQAHLAAEARVEKSHEDIKQHHKYAELRIKHATELAESKIKTAVDELESVKQNYIQALKNAHEKQKILTEELEQAKASRSDLTNVSIILVYSLVKTNMTFYPNNCVIDTSQQEVTFWKETHESQSYCNLTLIRHDSGYIMTRGIEGARGGLEVGQEYVMRAIEGARESLEVAQEVMADFCVKQFANVERLGKDIAQYIQKEMVPSIQSTVNSAHQKAIALYDENIAGLVDKKLIPVYNQHIYPVYNEQIQPAYEQHVAPLVKTIEKEAAVVIKKSQEEAQKARSNAATLVKKSSTSAIKLIEEKEADSFLPLWILDMLEQSSQEGEVVVDTLFKGILIMVLILFRSRVYGIIGFCFSCIWFFCPLRLLFRQSKDVSSSSSSSNTASNSAKSPQ
eukprot:scaffold27690_cov74-Cyclotella_meneghiniana.AAC.3